MTQRMEARFRLCWETPLLRTRGKPEHVERKVIGWANDALLYNDEGEYSNPTLFTSFDSACRYLTYLTDGCGGRFNVKDVAS